MGLLNKILWAQKLCLKWEKVDKPAETDLLERLRQQPEYTLLAAKMQPDPWQTMMLRRDWKRGLLLCSRQAGKSQTAATLALNTALLEPRSLILLLSPTLRQSGELFRDKLLPLWRAVGRPFMDRPPTQLSLELKNGSRIISLPGEEGGIRGYSGVKLLIVDEASKVPDDLYKVVRPMLAVSNGGLLCMSTPFGKRGFFYEEWESSRKWERVKITANECPRITKEFLAEEVEALGQRWFDQEYLCSFEEMIGAVFRQADIDAAFDPTLPPLFGATGHVIP